MSNIGRAVQGPNSTTDGYAAVFNGSSGDKIKHTELIQVSVDEVRLLGKLLAGRITDDADALIKLDGQGGVIQLQVSYLDGEVRLGDYDGGVYYQTINDNGVYIQTPKTVDIGDPDGAGNSTALLVDDPNELITLKADVGVVQSVPAAAPALAASQIAFFLDEGSDKLKVSVKYADGTTVKTGEVALT